MNGSIPYPADPAQEVTVSASALQTVVEQLLVKNSMFRFDAKVAAARMVEADLYGRNSHGVALLGRVLDAFKAGHIDPRAKVLTVNDAPSFAVLDGNRTIGSLAASQAAELAIAKAKETGLGFVTVGNSQTLGSGEVYVRMMSAAGIIGLCMSSSGGASITAPGTRVGAVGNTVLAYAVPIKDRPPLVFDSACGAASWNKLDLLRRYGIPIPDGLMFDESQTATTDLQEARSMVPAGGSLGYGLSFLCSVLAGPLCGGWMPIHKTRPTDAEDSQHIFLGIDPAKFCNFEKFSQELGASLDEIRALPPEEAGVPVRIPGDRGSACFEAHQKTGISLHRELIAEIKARAEKAKVTIDW